MDVRLRDHTASVAGATSGRGAAAALGVSLDMADSPSVEAAASSSEPAFGRVVILGLNSGGAPLAAAVEVSEPLLSAGCDGPLPKPSGGRCETPLRWGARRGTRSSPRSSASSARMRPATGRESGFGRTRLGAWLPNYSAMTFGPGWSVLTQVRKNASRPAWRAGPPEMCCPGSGSPACAVGLVRQLSQAPSRHGAKAVLHMPANPSQVVD